MRVLKHSARRKSGTLSCVKGLPHLKRNKLPTTLSDVLMASKQCKQYLQTHLSLSRKHQRRCSLRRSPPQNDFCSISDDKGFVMRSTLLWLFALGFLSTINGKDVICCPSNFVLVGKKCYFFSPERQTWQNAYWKCDTLNSTLAVINKAAQDDLLRKYLNKFRLGEQFFILNDRMNQGA